jgi:hypothetical protein
MSFIESKYVGLISVRLRIFSKKKIGLYNFRCPYCGDSQKYKNRARGYLYQLKNDYNFKCHNCGVTRTFANFLKDQDRSLYDEYVMEKYKEGLTGKATPVAQPEFNFKKPEFKPKSILSELDTIDSLNTSHPAKQYLINRKISEKDLKKIYYCPEFKKWTNKHIQIFDSIDLDDERIIIPLKDLDGNLFGYQGRSLNPNAKLRYITIMLDESVPKVYGLDQIDKNELVYITEGPFDSLFIRNAVAMCGADVYLDNWGINDVVWVYDNEPRNQQIVSRISRVIENGQKVVIWPSSIKEKDINEMVLSGYDVENVVKSNTYQGLEAKLKLLEWKKV